MSAQKLIDAEDILQDVFTKAFRQIGRYDPHRGASLYAWLKTIADHQLADAMKRMRRKKRGGDCRQLTPNDMGLQSTVAQLVDLVCQENHTASRSVARNDAAAAIQVGVASLPEDQRDAIRAKFFDGMNVEEIAQDMGRTPGAIRGLIHRAQKNLAEMMGRSSQWLSR